MVAGRRWGGRENKNTEVFPSPVLNQSQKLFVVCLLVLLHVQRKDGEAREVAGAVMWYGE